MSVSATPTQSWVNVVFIIKDNIHEQLDDLSLHHSKVYNYNNIYLYLYTSFNI